jgi:hypothetical protein
MQCEQCKEEYEQWEEPCDNGLCRECASHYDFLEVIKECGPLRYDPLTQKPDGSPK